MDIVYVGDEIDVLETMKMHFTQFIDSFPAKNPQTIEIKQRLLDWVNDIKPMLTQAEYDAIKAKDRELLALVKEHPLLSMVSPFLEFKPMPDPDDTIGSDSDSDELEGIDDLDFESFANEPLGNSEAEIEDTLGEQVPAEYLEDESPYCWLTSDSIKAAANFAIAVYTRKPSLTLTFEYDPRICLFGDQIDRVIMSLITQLTPSELKSFSPELITKIRSLVYYTLCDKHSVLESTGILQAARLANANAD